MEMAGSALRRMLMLAAPLAVAAAVAACSSGSGPSTPPGSSSPTTSGSSPAPSAPAGLATNSCDVITTAQASAALGQTVKPPVRGHATVEGGVACVYYGPQIPAGTNPDVPVGDSVRVVLVRGPKAKRYFDDYRSKVHAQAISGLGDEAYYDGYASLSVLKGDAYLRVYVAALSIAKQIQVEEMVAREALPRM